MNMLLKEQIDLDLDEQNELKFKVQIEGTDVSPARVRLVCEGDDLSYTFKGYGSDEPGVVVFDIPRMKGRITEGVYQATVEVLVDNRYFAPVQFEVNFKEPVKVTVESANIIKKKPQEMRVSAVPILVEKRTPRVTAQPTTPPPAPQKRLAQIESRLSARSSLADKLAARKSGLSESETKNIINQFTNDALK